MIHNNYTLLFLHGTFNCSLSSDSNTAQTALWYGMLCVCWSTIYTRLCLWLSKCGENETMLTNHNNKFKMKKMTSRTTAIYVCVCVFYVYIFLFVSFIRYLNSMSECFFFLLFCLISFLQSNWFFRFTQLHSFQCLSVSSVFFFSYLFISLVYH